MPNCEVTLLDEGGSEVQAGQVGELVVRGANIMQGYWHDPEGSAHVFREGLYPADRRLYSGDYFYRGDGGNLFFVGRKDDMIKCRGERISPREIEAVLLKMDGIKEAAVKGVQDDIDGHAIVAFVVISPEAGIRAEDVRRHCRRYLENVRVPRHICFRDAIPRNSRGKVDWAQIRFDEQLGRQK